jgi:phage FluMu protein Com
LTENIFDKIRCPTCKIKLANAGGDKFTCPQCGFVDHISVTDILVAKAYLSWFPWLAGKKDPEAVEE